MQRFGTIGIIAVLLWLTIVFIIRFFIKILNKNNSDTALPTIDTDKKQFIRPTILLVVSILGLIFFVFNFFRSF